jgi:hypothetical protein
MPLFFKFLNTRFSYNSTVTGNTVIGYLHWGVAKLEGRSEEVLIASD